MKIYLAFYTNSNLVLTSLGELAQQMTAAEIAESERLVRAWKSDPKSCEVVADQMAGKVGERRERFTLV